MVIVPLLRVSILTNYNAHYNPQNESCANSKTKRSAIWDFSKNETVAIR